MKVLEWDALQELGSVKVPMIDNRGPDGAIYSQEPTHEVTELLRAMSLKIVAKDTQSGDIVRAS